MGAGAVHPGDGALVVYADYACGLCYLLESMLEGLEQAGVQVARRGLELRPAPEPLPAPADADMLRHWRNVIEPAARRLDAEMHVPPVWPRTRKAHELAAFAREHGRFEETHAALYRALFVQGRDIGRIDVLIEIAGEVGLDASSAHIALGVDRYADDVLRCAREARERGVDRLPAVRYGMELLVGLPSPEQLRAIARRRTAQDADGNVQDVSGMAE